MIWLSICNFYLPLVLFIVFCFCLSLCQISPFNNCFIRWYRLSFIHLYLDIEDNVVIWLGGGIVDIKIKEIKTNLLIAKPIKYYRVKSNFTLETYLKWSSNYFVLICGKNEALSFDFLWKIQVNELLHLYYLSIYLSFFYKYW